MFNSEMGALNSSNIYYLGEGTTFDVSSINGYQKFTVDNFLVDCGSYSISGSVTIVGRSSSNSTKLTKSYDAQKGILTIGNASLTTSAGANHNACWNYGDSFSDAYVGYNATTSRKPQVWLATNVDSIVDL